MSPEKFRDVRATGLSKLSLNLNSYYWFHEAIKKKWFRITTGGRLSKLNWHCDRIKKRGLKIEPRIPTTMWNDQWSFHVIREFKKLRRQLQQKRHIKFELCVRLSLLRLFHVGRVVQNRRSALSLAWHEWFSCKGKDWKIYCCELALSSELQIWKFNVVFWQTTSKHCIKKLAARAARLFFLYQPIKSLICGVVVDVAVVKS